MTSAVQILQRNQEAPLERLYVSTLRTLEEEVPSIINDAFIRHMNHGLRSEELARDGLASDREHAEDIAHTVNENYLHRLRNQKTMLELGYLMDDTADMLCAHKTYIVAKGEEHFHAILEEIGETIMNRAKALNDQQEHRKNEDKPLLAGAAHKLLRTIDTEVWREFITSASPDLRISTLTNATEPADDQQHALALSTIVGQALKQQTILTEFVPASLPELKKIIWDAFQPLRDDEYLVTPESRETFSRVLDNTAQRILDYAEKLNVTTERILTERSR